jgi:predicted enzyme related to lactoylglutathione lyase
MREDFSIDYVELAAGDLATSRRFFEEAFRWRFVDYGASYAGFEGAGLDGGLRADGDSGVASPLVILYAADLEGAKARVLGAGGEVTREIFSFPGGRRFHFREPAGAEMAVWSEAARAS